MRVRTHAAGVFALVLAVAGLAAPALGQDRSGLSLASAQAVAPAKLTATGRVQAMVTARVGSRVSGHIASFAKDAEGRMLDAGASVKAGDTLFTLETTTFANTKGVAEARVRSAEAARDNVRAGTRPERVEQIKQSLAELDARIADRQRDEKRFVRLVEVEKSLPERRLEEVRTELAVLQAQKVAADARLAEAKNGPTATELAMAEAAVAEAKAALKIAEDDLRDTTVRAPFDGLITRRFKSPGDYLTSTPVTEVLEIVAADRLEVELRLPEAYLPAIHPGKTLVTLRTPLLARELPVAITRVIGDVDPAKGTFAARILIAPEQRGGLVPGAFVTADVQVEDRAAGVLVPLRAIVEAEGKSAVFVAHGGKMSRRPVEVGERLTEGAIVRSGIIAGQKVVVGPPEAMKDGAVLPDHLRQPE